MPSLASAPLTGAFVLAVGLSAAARAEPAPEPSTEEIGSVAVYLTPEEARAQAFPGAHFETRPVPITDGLRARARARGLTPFAADSVAVYIARDAAGGLLGYAVGGDEVGKYRPITFLVAVDAGLAVTSVAILVYRESRGGEVRRQRFLNQYRGKDGDDPIRIDRDIVNITGATLSVRALNGGVRKALLLLQAAFGAGPDR